MKIPIIFLGTGQAIPTVKRNHTAVLIKYKTENILVDCGEGTQRQFRKAKLNPCKLTKLLITHWHGDHILGIPGLLQTLQLNRYPRTLEIYGPKGTKKFMALMLKLFIKVGRMKIQVKEIKSGKVFETPDFIIQATPMKHQAPCLAYSLIEKSKLRINKNKLKKLKLKGKQIKNLIKNKFIKIKNRKINLSELSYKQEGKKITIIMDTAINTNAIKLAENSDLLICESTFLENSENGKRLAKEYKHLTAKQAALIAKKAKAKKLILTHLSQRHEKDSSKILQEAKKVFKNTTIAEDLDKTEV